MNNFVFANIQTILNRLLSGDLSVIDEENTNLLNTTAMEIYNTPREALLQSDIFTLKNIILICNILYNRTAMTVLPIEDGFYDLLLELYKKFDENFQVGSFLVDFDQNSSVDELQKVPEIVCPIEFINKKERNDLQQSIYDKIIMKDKSRLNYKDLYRSPIEFEASYIPKRLHNIEHNHPMLVGTLDKAKFVLIKDALDAGALKDPNVSIFERDFIMDHLSKGIYNENTELEIVCELKYDGVSVEADCNFTVQSARSRGDTGIGEASDMTPILKDYIFKQADCMIGEEPLGVKFEAIMTYSDLYRFNQARGKKYANCRTAIVGLFGASDAYMFKDYITLVPLALDLEQFNRLHPNTPITNRLDEIAFINRVFVSNGEPLRYCYFKGTPSEILYMVKLFVDEAKYARNFLNFMYDGVVVNIINPDVKEKLGRKNYINKYAIAIKFDALEKQTTFRGYTYEVGQHGNITPMIHYDPVEFNGTIHTKSTGSSYERFKDLNLKIGDIINVTYVNDVMPYVSRLDCEHNRDNPNPPVSFVSNCPVCGSILTYSDSGKTAICPNNECPARTIKRMTNMFAKMNIKGFAEATFEALKATSLYELCQYREPELKRMLGEADGSAMFRVITDLVTVSHKDYIIMGSLGFTGMAHKKWQDILTKIKLSDMYNKYVMLKMNCCNTIDVAPAFLSYLTEVVPNIGEITAKTIAYEFEYFLKDIEFILQCCPLDQSYGTDMSGRTQVRFTGFRNSQLVEQLITAGYDAGDGSITKNTNILLIPYDGFNSTKVTKARQIPNIQIMTESEFREKYNIH